jgi:hypothetical protein
LAIGQDLLGDFDIIMNFNDQIVTWDANIIPIKDRDKIYHSIINGGLD